MKNNLKYFFLLFSLISFSLNDKETTIKIVTTREEEEQTDEVTDTIQETTVPGNESDEPTKHKGNHG